MLYGNSYNMWLYNEIEFPDYNYGFFDSFDDFVSHAIKTFRKFELIHEDPQFVVPIFYNAVAGMNKSLGRFYCTFLEGLGQLDTEIQGLISDEVEVFTQRTGSTISQYFIDKEYAILSLNISLKTNTNQKVQYLEQRANYYHNAVTRDNIKNEEDLKTISRYIDFCYLYIDLLNTYDDEFSKITVKEKEIRDIRFINKLIVNDVIDSFKKEGLIHKKYYDKLDSLLNDGKRAFKRNNTKKIFFKGNQKTLAFCFYELNKYKLIIRLDDPDVPYTEKEIADIIIDNFYLDGINKRSIYDYLRNGQNNRPLNPIFLIRKSEKNGIVGYKLHKPAKRSKGEPIKPEDL